MSSYIHLNPYRAGLEDWLSYPASSLPDCLGKRKPLIENLDTNFILRQFHPQLTHSRKLYLQYLQENLNLEYPKEEVYHGIALGQEDFIKRIEKYIYSYGKDREIHFTHSLPKYSPEEIINQISHIFQVTQKEVLAKQRGNIYRAMR